MAVAPEPAVVGDPTPEPVDEAAPATLEEEGVDEPAATIVKLAHVNRVVLVECTTILLSPK